MADEAPAENAPAAEGAGTNEIYTDENGNQTYESLATLVRGSTWIDVPGSKRYMTGRPGSWGGFKGLPHGPDPKEGPPPSVQTILDRLGIPREETMCFEALEKAKPWQIYSSWRREEEKCMPFPAHAAWSGFKVELPSLESWGPEGPPSHYKSFYPSTSYRGTVTGNNGSY